MCVAPPKPLYKVQVVGNNDTATYFWLYYFSHSYGDHMLFQTGQINK